jgi:Uma2 family endonuclease
MVVRQKVTLEEFLKLPSSERLEFVDGEVIEKVSPKGKHSVLTRYLSRTLEDLASSLGFEVLPEARFIFGSEPRAYIPDISVVSRSKIPIDERGRIADDFDFAPDLTIEILSPGDRPGLLYQKLSYYLESGVRLALAFDPEVEKVTVDLVEQRGTLLGRGDVIALDPVLPGVALSVDEIFDALVLEG